MSKPALVALHRDVQVIGCGCEGCKGLGDSEFVAETREKFEESLTYVPVVTVSGGTPTPLPPADHEHLRGATIRVEYNAGVPYGIVQCAVCGIELPRNFY